ncbi:MAG: hypothetical protein ACTSVM_01400, partial [Candidatus Ranarchaeia archaeon]
MVSGNEKTFVPRLLLSDSVSPIPRYPRHPDSGRLYARKRNHDSCGIAGFLNVDGSLDSGSTIKTMMQTIIDRENGLGGGYAAYGLFPDYPEKYAIQILADNLEIQEKVFEFLKDNTVVVHDEEIPTKKVASIKPPYPIAWRYFLSPPQHIPPQRQDDYIVDLVMYINADIKGAFCLSSGKNMAVFKGNGWAHEIADNYRIENYKAYLW